jgi:hypothetical protein
MIPWLKTWSLDRWELDGENWLKGKNKKYGDLGEIKLTNPSHVLGVLCTRFNAQCLRIIINNCTSRSNENKCNNSGEVLKKMKDKMKFSLSQKLIVFWIPPWPSSLCMTKLRVLVLCFPCLTDNSICLWFFDF